MEPLGGRVPALEQPQVPTEARQPGSPESSPRLAETVKEPAGAGPDPSCEKLPPAPRPARLRPSPLNLGYGAFRRPGSGRAGSPGSPTCRCRCQELQQEEDAAPLHRAGVDGDQKLPRATALIGLPMYMKSLHWALAVMAVLLAISAVAIVALASRAGARCQPCPPGWMWAEEHCYYFSAEAQAWEASQAFCSAQGATLPLLDHTQGLLIRYAVTKDSWMGVQRGQQGWHWIDGTPLPPQLFPEDEDNPNLNCGGLEEGKLVALDCSSPRPWVCAKETE
ncbi:PREDICTED: killer cell lectin-like receptor subfamily G member 2 [Galeopterus variegatus]|uniref:Killer cell lectin-like receptor subfamily G member 2 n=1 Tax=Galeopterus variegatus TaxID=482537 RepID=A0ABM0S744_GALVR|nr:PREDICTED: killer cell lectin-like receptor subfamily G member 2 [Galeopterus variegatus]